MTAACCDTDLEVVSRALSVEDLDGRKLDGKVGPVGAVRGDIDSPFVQRDDPLSEGQTETKTPDIRRTWSAIERLKDLGYLVRRDDRSLVDDLHIHLMMRKAQIHRG